MTVVLALLAISVPASVTLVGYWFKNQSEKRLAQEQQQSTDRLALEKRESEAQLAQEHQQTEARLAEEHQQTEARLAQEQRQQNDRLRLDAAMRAADLFGSSNRAEGNAARSASGLLALTRLGFADLAVALLVHLWSPKATSEPSAEAEAQALPPGLAAKDSSSVSPETAIQVIDAALETDEPDTQVMAAELLCRNAKALDICNSLHWPSSVNSVWIPELPVTAKLLIVDALIQMALVSEHTQNALRELAVRLYGISTGDPERRVKGCIGTLMKAILPAVEGLGYQDFMKGPGHGLVTLDEMRYVAGEASHHPDGFFEMIVKDRSEKLKEWSNECKVVSFSPGKLATAGLALRGT